MVTNLNKFLLEKKLKFKIKNNHLNYNLFYLIQKMNVFVLFSILITQQKLRINIHKPAN